MTKRFLPMVDHPKRSTGVRSDRVKDIVLVQPRHIYAPQDGLGHVYLPNSLLTVAARIEAAGIPVRCQDGNLRPLRLDDTEHIGANLVGIPYVPEVQKQILNILSPSQTLIVGGQVVTGIAKNREHFKAMFGPKATNGNDDQQLAAELGIPANELPPPLQTSLVPVYEKMSSEDLYRYLVEEGPEGTLRPREFSFFLSQGCKYACSFCAADRTQTQSDARKVVKEMYRDVDVIKRDLDFLASKMCQYKVNALEMYLSNLDLFQTPEKLEEFAAVVMDVRRSHSNMPIRMRCLSTVHSFLYAVQHHPAAVTAICNAGLHTVGFGVDGSTPKVWNSIKKGHNRSVDDCLDAIRIARQQYGLRPEVLMVFGHEKEGEEDLRLDEQFTVDMLEKFGATPRPQVMKDLIPGNDHWLLAVHARRVDFLLQNPEYMQALDFTATASSISHRDPVQRQRVNRHFIKIASLSDQSTKVIQALDPEFSEEQRAEMRRNNEGLYDR